MNEHLELKATSEFEDSLRFNEAKYSNPFIQKYMAYAECIADAQINIDNHIAFEDYHEATKFRNLKSIFLQRHAKFCLEYDFKQI